MSLGTAASEYWTRVKGGDLGALPAVFGVVVLVVIFGIMESDAFLSNANFANLINQGAAIIVLAMGLVFVLLLGEIDLSAGFAAGMGAAILAVHADQARTGRGRWRSWSRWRPASRSAWPSRCWSRGWASRASS